MAEKPLGVLTRETKGIITAYRFFKTIQGVHAWIGPFHIVFAASCCGISVLASVLFYITFHLLSDRGFKVFQVLAT